MEKVRKGAIACPECGCMFVGRYFYRGNERGKYRRCPNGHEFKNPPKPKKEKTCAQCIIYKEALKKACEWIIGCIDMENAELAMHQINAILSPKKEGV